MLENRLIASVAVGLLILFIVGLLALAGWAVSLVIEMERVSGAANRVHAIGYCVHRRAEECAAALDD